MPLPFGAGLAGPVRRPGDLPVPRRPAGLREVGDQAAGSWRSSRWRATSGALRAIDEGRFDREITPVGGVTTDEGPRRDTSLEKMAEPEAAARGLGADRGDGVPDLRRRRRAADRLAGRGQRLRPHAAGPDPHADGHRLRPGLHAHRARSPRPSRRSPGAGLTIGDIDVFEVNEAFAPVLSPGRRTPAPRWRRPTRTAARSRSVTRSARPARS